MIGRDLLLYLLRSKSKRSSGKEETGLTYPSSKLNSALALDQNIDARGFGWSQYSSDFVACFVHASKKADVSRLDKVEFSRRADWSALIYDDLSGFLIATNNDDF